MALGEAERLPESELPLALDRATIGVSEHARALHDAWASGDLPQGVIELLHDARAALARARTLGVEWSVDADRIEWGAPDDWLDELTSRGFEGEVLAAPAGTILFRDEPAAFARPVGAPDPQHAPLRRRVACPRQVFRQMSDDGVRVERDLVVPFEASLVAGRPLLVPMLERGVRLHQTDPAMAARWRADQARALGDGPVRVELAREPLAE